MYKKKRKKKKRKKENKQTNKQTKKKTKQQQQQQQQNKTLTWIPIQKHDLSNTIGIMRRARDVDQYPQTQPDGNRGGEAENADQD